MSDRGKDIAGVALLEPLHRLEQFIVRNGYRGYDPYDALESPVFKFPILRSNRRIRWAAQQVFKRIPINLRPFLRIPHGCNPVTLGLCLDAYTVLVDMEPDRRSWYEQEMVVLLERLDAMQSRPFHGSCWGYDFDWESRHARFPAATPTVVATGIISNALFAFHRKTGNARAGELCVSAAEFVVKDLRRHEEGGGFCFSYSPYDTNHVVNATMKGARILAQAYSLTGEKEYKDLACQTVRFVARHQQSNGSWAYAVGDGRSWADNFHTGYILDCLQDYQSLTGDWDFEGCRKKGLEYFVEHFIDPDGAPRYYDTTRYPIDSTAAAQCILTLLRNGLDDRAMAVARFMTNHMQDKTGYFYYQMGPRFTNRISYMRWSNAWMLTALAHLAERCNVLA
jgi:rhamnogalacturonyl hydrolase YesR